MALYCKGGYHYVRVIEAELVVCRIGRIATYNTGGKISYVVVR